MANKLSMLAQCSCSLSPQGSGSRAGCLMRSGFCASGIQLFWQSHPWTADPHLWDATHSCGHNQQPCSSCFHNSHAEGLCQGGIDEDVALDLHNSTTAAMCDLPPPRCQASATAMQGGERGFQSAGTKIKQMSPARPEKMCSFWCIHADTKMLELPAKSPCTKEVKSRAN